MPATLTPVPITTPLVKHVGALGHMISVRGTCNLSCMFCNMFHEVPKIDAGSHLADLQAEIDQLAASGVRKVLWGVFFFEPTTFPYLGEIIAYARERGITGNSLITNGINTADLHYLKELRDCGLTSISMSLYEFGEWSADILTQSTGVLDAKRRTIENCIALGVQHSSTVLMMRVNYRRLGEILKLFGKYYTRLNISSVYPGMGNRNRWFLPPLTGLLQETISVGKGLTGLSLEISDMPLCFRKRAGPIPQTVEFRKTFVGEFPPFCDSCDMKPDCSGFRKEYLDIYGTAEVEEGVVLHNPISLDELQSKCDALLGTMARAQVPPPVNGRAKEAETRVAPSEDETETVHERRHWVRITRTCNQRCAFCLDADQQSGPELFVPEETVYADIRKGREIGAKRLIISGGEASINPNFLKYVRYGSDQGYRWIQTITNGRMWRYEALVRQAVDAGLREITFSIHGHTARLHDAQTRVKGAFREAMTGLDRCLAHPSLVVSVDVVINKRNYASLPKIISFLYDRGVREVDLDHIIPFGRADDDRGHQLWITQEELEPYLRETLAFCRRKKMTVWTNRVPLPLLEGYEEHMQNPHHFHDEVTGRRRELGIALGGEGWLPCKGRCDACFLQQFCADLEDCRDQYHAGQLAHGWWDVANGAVPPTPTVKHLTVEATELADALHALDGYRPIDGRLTLVLAEAFDASLLKTLIPISRERRVVATSARAAACLRAMDSFQPALALRRETNAWLAKNPTDIHGLVLVPYQESHTRDYARFGARYRGALADTPSPALIEGFVPCQTPTASSVYEDQLPRPWPLGLVDASGSWDLHGLTEGQIRFHYATKSRRCARCVVADACRGLHVPYVREFGLQEVRPILE